MAIRLNWDNAEKTILLCEYVGGWTLEDAYRAIDQSSEMLASVSHEVDVIIDFSQGTMKATNLLSSAGYVERKPPLNQRLMLVSGASSFIKIIAGMVSKITPRATEKTRFVNNIDEARQLIAQAQTV